jgi:hypothetical protein
VIRWRTQGEHHGAQEKGRFEVFEDYHLRVGEINTGPPKGTAVREQRFDATEIGKAKVVTITELEPRENSALGANADQLGAHLGLRVGTDGLIDQEVFESIYPGKLLLLAGWRDGEAAEASTPTKPDAAASLRHRRVRVIRDYGMSDRREAPQFYPDVKRGADAPPAARRRAVG